MNLEEFEAEVRRVLEELPGEYREILSREEVEVICRDRVPQAVRERHSGRTVLGIFTGISREKAGRFSSSVEPTRIEIYRESFERVYGTGITERMRDNIYRTVVHEIAHYLGFDEESIRRLGY